MYCVKCGNPMADNAAFCPKCGAQQRQAQPQRPVQPNYSYQQRNYGYQQPNYAYQQQAKPMKVPGVPIYDIIVYSIAGFLLLGLLLPFITKLGRGSVESQNIFGMSGEGACIFAGVLILLSFIGYGVMYLLNCDKLMWIPGAVVATAQLIATLSVAEELSTWNRYMGSMGVIGFGVGYYFVWIAASFMIAFPFVSKPLAPYIGPRKIYIKR